MNDYFPNWIIPLKKVYHSNNVRDWCKLPYPGHSKGCPNYGCKSKCPPISPYFTELFDLEKDIYFIFSEFDLEGHINSMKIKHPNWTDKQLRNVLYWQGKARKELRNRIWQARKFIDFDCISITPESNGVNVYRTCAHHGLLLNRIKGLKINKFFAIVGKKYGT